MQVIEFDRIKVTVPPNINEWKFNFNRLSIPSQKVFGHILNALDFRGQKPLIKSISFSVDQLADVTRLSGSQVKTSIYEIQRKDFLRDEGQLLKLGDGRT